MRRARTELSERSAEYGDACGEARRCKWSWRGSEDIRTGREGWEEREERAGAHEPEAERKFSRGERDRHPVYDFAGGVRRGRAVSPTPVRSIISLRLGIRYQSRRARAAGGARPRAGPVVGGCLALGFNANGRTLGVSSGISYSEYSEYTVGILLPRPE